MLEVGTTAWRFGSGGLASDLASQAEIAEKMGIHSFWLPENHFGGDNSIPSPLMLLAGVASRTSRIKLGSTSYLLPIRHPIQAAEEVAVLDRMSGGRVILGIGRGFQNSLFTAYGIPSSEKRKRFKTTLAAMINAWEGKPVAHHDDGESQTPIYLSPLPVQQPYPELWVAAFGPLALKQAGGLGLPYLASPVETDLQLADNYQRHQSAISEAGLPPVEKAPIMRTMFISTQPSQIRQVREHLAKESADRRGGVTDPDAWTIIGDEHYARDRLAQLQSMTGMTHLIARGRVPGISDEDQQTSMSALLKITS